MAEAETLRSIAQKRLRQRLFRAGDKQGYLFEGDHEAVELEPRLWTAVSTEYDNAAEHASKQLKWAFMLTIPTVIATLAVITNVSLLDNLTKRIDAIPGMGALLVLVVVTWLPLTGLYRHARAINRAHRRLEARLADLPRIAPPERHPRLHHNLEIVITVLVGPAILVRAIGSLFPDLYRNTPLSGAQLGWIDLLAALAVIAWFATRPRSNDR